MVTEAKIKSLNIVSAEGIYCNLAHPSAKNPSLLTTVDNSQGNIFWSLFGDTPVVLLKLYDTFFTMFMAWSR
jgi:hypothetical protein